MKCPRNKGNGEFSGGSDRRHQAQQRKTTTVSIGLANKNGFMNWERIVSRVVGVDYPEVYGR